MSERSSGWDLEFDGPIALERGGKLVTLRDATNYITALPANEAALPNGRPRSWRISAGRRCLRASASCER
jgi:hypothetical protein